MLVVATGVTMIATTAQTVLVTVPTREAMYGKAGVGKEQLRSQEPEAGAGGWERA
jgi:hypothetical protein